MQEIIAHWRFTADFARDVGVKPGVAQKWKERRSIPAKYDNRVVSAAARRGYPIKHETLARLRATEAEHKAIPDGGLSDPDR